MHQVSTLPSPSEPCAKFLKWLEAVRVVSWRAKEGEAVDAVHQQRMIVVLHGKSRDGDHKTAHQRNLAVVASAPC